MKRPVIKNKFAHQQQGMAVVEVTVALPLLLFLLLATAEFGYLLYQYNTLTKLPRDGIRYMATNAVRGAPAGNATTDLAEEVRNLVVYGDPDGLDAGGSSLPPLLENLTPDDVTVSDNGSFVEVNISYTHIPLVFTQLPTFGLGEPIDMRLQLNTGMRMPALL